MLMKNFCNVIITFIYGDKGGQFIFFHHLRGVGSRLLLLGHCTLSDTTRFRTGYGLPHKKTAASEDTAAHCHIPFSIFLISFCTAYHLHV